MKEVYEFASGSPWLAFFMFWIGCWTVVSIAYVPLKLANRVLRCINIAIRGYPTIPNMDADGDIVHPKTGDE